MFERGKPSLEPRNTIKQWEHYLKAGVDAIGQVDNLRSLCKAEDIQVMWQKLALLQQLHKARDVSTHTAELFQEPGTITGRQLHQLLSSTGCSSLHHQVTPAKHRNTEFFNPLRSLGEKV